MLFNNKLNRQLESESVTSLQAFAQQWDISVENIEIKERQYCGFVLCRILVGLTVEFVNPAGSGRAELYVPSRMASWFWFRPKTDNGIMLPPWAAFPGSTRFNQGYQEAYFNEWSTWLGTKTTQEKNAYQSRYPKPDWVLHQHVYD